jgi:hypothetical protein
MYHKEPPTPDEIKRMSRAEFQRACQDLAAREAARYHARLNAIETKRTLDKFGAQPQPTCHGFTREQMIATMTARGMSRLMHQWKSSASSAGSAFQILPARSTMKDPAWNAQVGHSQRLRIIWLSAFDGQSALRWRGPSRLISSPRAKRRISVPVQPVPEPQQSPHGRRCCASERLMTPKSYWSTRLTLQPPKWNRFSS